MSVRLDHFHEADLEDLIRFRISRSEPVDTTKYRDKSYYRDLWMIIFDESTIDYSPYDALQFDNIINRLFEYILATWDIPQTCIKTRISYSWIKEGIWRKYPTSLAFEGNCSRNRKTITFKFRPLWVF